MSFENYLKALMPEQETTKESSVDVGNLNTQEAVLETHSKYDVLGEMDIEDHLLPLEISLVVTLRPQKLLDVKGDYSVSFSSKDVDFSPTTLGELSGDLVQDCCAAIDLIWQGEGSQKAEHALVEPLCEELQDCAIGTLHTKTFTLPPGDSFFSKEIYTDEGLWVYDCPLWEAPKFEEHPVIPLGGYFHKGLDLEMIMPMYGLLGTAAHKTDVVIKGQSYWQRAGLYPGRRGQIFDRHYSFIPLPQPIVQTSLAQDVRGGKIRFGTSEASYVSYDYDFIDPETNTILLHLKQG